MTADELREVSQFLLGFPGNPGDLVCVPLGDIQDKDCVHFHVVNGEWKGLFFPATNRMFIIYPAEPGLHQAWRNVEFRG